MALEPVAQQLGYSAVHPEWIYSMPSLVLSAFVAMAAGVLPTLLQARTTETESPIALGTIFGMIGLVFGALQFITGAWQVQASLIPCPFAVYYYASIDGVSSMCGVLGSLLVGPWMLATAVAAWRRGGMSKGWVIWALSRD